MPDDSAITAVVRAVRCAAGVFAPGHLGELTQYLPFELVDSVLENTRKVQRRPRDLPSRVGVYFVLALCLFPEADYLGVWGKLTVGLAGAGAPAPSEKALRDLRRRSAWRRCGRCSRSWPGHWPARPCPAPATRGLRTVAFDGNAFLAAVAVTARSSWSGSARVDDVSIRLRADLRPSTWRDATAALEEHLCLPEVDDKALAGLKFSDALPHHLATATLAARLADLSHAASVLAEPVRFER